MRKLILTDVDGVTVNWYSHYFAYLDSKGYKRVQEIDEAQYDRSAVYGLTRGDHKALVNAFNSSGWMLDCPPMRDAVYNIYALRRRGFEFHAISAFETDIYSLKLRQMNLDNLFGEGTFTKVIGTDHEAPYDGKDKILRTYAERLFWIEDKMDNAIVGAELGHRALLLNQPYNDQREHPLVERVYNWRHIFEVVMKTYNE